MMRALICGSMAYDTIMVFADHFKNHILPDALHQLNVSFLVPQMRREFGGCAGNIAYNLKLLGDEPVIMGTVGQDFAPYAARLDTLQISRQHILQLEDAYTAQAFITTDLADNQITAFHPGAMSDSHRVHVADATDIALGIVSPDGRDGMLAHAQEFADAAIPFIFDPGQGMPMFAGADLLKMLHQARAATFNDYEARMMVERTGQSLERLAEGLEALIVTRGEAGSTIYTDGRQLQIPPVQPAAVVDPTGCGDAYRAGLLYGMMRGLDWEITGRLASLLGAIKIASRGGQNHTFTPAIIAERFQSAFGLKLH